MELDITGLRLPKGLPLRAVTYEIEGEEYEDGCTDPNRLRNPEGTLGTPLGTGTITNVLYWNRTGPRRITAALSHQEFLDRGCPRALGFGFTAYIDDSKNLL